MRAMIALGFVVCSSPALAAENLPTVLYERTDSGTRVAKSQIAGAPYCLMAAQTHDKAAGIVILMNGGGAVEVGMIDRREGSPMRSLRKGATLPLAVEVDGTRQVYQVKRSDDNFAEAAPGRASQNHLRKAMQSSGGMRLILANSEPVAITVEDEAEQAFDQCVRSILRQRMEDMSKRMERMAR